MFMLVVLMPGVLLPVLLPPGTRLRQEVIMQADAMQAALDEARAAAGRGEVPVGAVVMDPAGRILARAGNRVEAGHDAAAHAEMLALRAAAQALGSPRLIGCDLVVTLEPCAMCAAAAGLFRIRRVVFGAYDPKGGGVEHGARIYAAPGAQHRPEVVGGVREAEAAALLRDFFAALR
jgi:tRNA(adenine34) deaminase